MSCVAANQDSVFLRFAYRQAPETGTAYSHYYWGIDDVTVSSNDVVNDIEIIKSPTVMFSMCGSTERRFWAGDSEHDGGWLLG